MNKEPRTMQMADTATAARAPENTPAMVKKIGKTTYKAVSYTHLDVYKRQSVCCAAAPKWLCIKVWRRSEKNL